MFSFTIRFMSFDHYCIPRDNLLNRTGDVSSEGQYVTPYKVIMYLQVMHTWEYLSFWMRKWPFYVMTYPVSIQQLGTVTREECCAGCYNEYLT